MPSFASARVKLIRAKHHFESLKAAIEPIEETNLATLVREYDSDARQNRWRWQGVPKDALTDLSPIIGDILTNAFACLDHIMYAFLGGTIPDRDIYWPVSTKPNDWSSAKGRHKGLPANALSIIEDFQPTEGSDSFATTWMATLHILVNIDKHRRLILLTRPVRVITTKGDDSVVGAITIDFSALVEEGAVLATLDGEEVNVELNPILQVGFGESGGLRNHPVIQFMAYILATVEKALERFENAFP